MVVASLPVTVVVIGDPVTAASVIVEPSKVDASVVKKAVVVVKAVVTDVTCTVEVV